MTARSNVSARNQKSMSAPTKGPSGWSRCVMAIADTKQTERSDRRYIAAAMEAPFLDRDYEQELGRRWREHKDHAALNELIESHARLVVRIASRYRSSAIPLGDLVQEGNIGLMEAAI